VPNSICITGLRITNLLDNLRRTPTRRSMSSSYWVWPCGASSGPTALNTNVLPDWSRIAIDDFLASSHTSNTSMQRIGSNEVPSFRKRFPQTITRGLSPAWHQSHPAPWSGDNLAKLCREIYNITPACFGGFISKAVDFTPDLSFRNHCELRISDLNTTFPKIELSPRPRAKPDYGI
jgi:hypothetical protein